LKESGGINKRAYLHRLNPSYKLIGTILMLFVIVTVHTLTQAIVLAVIPLLIMFTLGGMSFRLVIKRLTPFAIFFLFYILIQAGYSSTQDKVVYHFLWMHFSKTGLMNGLVLALRMLTSVEYGILFVSTTDFTLLIVSLYKNLHVPPKFAYGILAGVRFMPLFHEEWRKLKNARSLRGADARWSFTRILTYPLPLLSHAIRTSERVAVAMEARGFTNGPRTLYREVYHGKWDVVYIVGILGANLVILLSIR
jgi:energy-coupling factor transport system permease/ATP-binding protein